MKLKSPRQREQNPQRITFPIAAIVSSVFLLTISPFIVMYGLSWLYLNQGDNLVKEGKLTAAIASYKNTIPLNFQSALAQFKLAQVYQKQNEIILAFNAYQKAFYSDVNLKVDPSYNQDLVKLADTLKSQYHNDEAIWSYQQAIKIDPKVSKNYEKLGQILSEQSSWTEAIDSYEKALKLAPQSLDIYLNLGKAYNQQKAWEKTIYVLEQARQIKPEQADIYPILGKAYQEQKDYQKAINTYLQALTYSPDDAQVYNQLGQSLQKQKKLPEAIAAYQKAGQLAPKNGEIDKNLCFAYHQVKELKKAIAACTQAFQKDPNLGDAKFYAQEIERGMIIYNNPQVLKMPERIPTAQQDPLISRKRAIVKIIFRSRQHNGIGTGWLFKKDQNKAWIITNRHVATNVEQIKDPRARIFVEFYSQPLPNQVRQRRRAKLIQTTPPGHWLDIAVLEIDNLPPDIQPLSLGSSVNSLNQPVKVIGHPFNQKDWSVSKGEVRDITEKELILAMVLVAGQSGSPIFDPKNQVIGVVSQAGLFCSQSSPAASLEMSFRLGCGLAVPIEEVRKQLQTGGILGNYLNKAS